MAGATPDGAMAKLDQAANFSVNLTQIRDSTTQAQSRRGTKNKKYASNRSWRGFC
jgi:hypothetical protein